MCLEYIVDFDESIHVLYDWYKEDATKWKQKIYIYHTVRRIPQSNIKIVDRDKIDENIKMISAISS